MAFIFSPTPFTGNPFTPCAVDWSNPLTDGLTFAALDVGNGNFYSIIQRGYSTWSNASFVSNSVYPHPWIGKYSAFNGSAGTSYFPKSTFTNVDVPTGPVTLAAVVVLTAVPIDFTGFGRTAENSASGPFVDYCFNIRQTSGTINGFTFLYSIGGGSFYTVTSSAFMGLNQPSIFMGSIGGADGLGTFMMLHTPGHATNEYVITTDAAHSSYTPDETNSDYIVAGGSNAGTGDWIGAIPLHLVWNRGLTKQEALKFAKNPYQVLRPSPMVTLRNSIGARVPVIPSFRPRRFVYS